MKKILLFQSYGLSLLTTGSILIALPSYGMSIVSFSQLDLRISNFNQFPDSVTVDIDVDAINIAQEGILNTTIEGDATFFAKDSTVFSHAFFQTLTTGEGRQFFGLTDISTNLLGEFLIPAQETLSFDLAATLFLNNFIEEGSKKNASSLIQIHVGLQNRTLQNSFELLRIMAGLNTNLDREYGQDIMNIKIAPSLQLLSYEQQVSLGENREFFQLILTASFQLQVEEDTQLIFRTNTRTCNYASDEQGVCRIPEPPNRLTMIFGLSLLIYRTLILSIMKQMIKLAR